MSGADSELEDDEEEILVYVEFDNSATNDMFSSENLKLDMLGLDSDHPVMQINGKFFQGTYEDAVGTYLFFEKDNHPEYDDPVFDKIPTLKYFDKTRKVLRMQRAFLVPRHEVVGDSKHSECIPNVETLKEAGVPSKYEEEALSYWQKSRKFRMDALDKYLKKQEFRKELRQRGFEPESESDEENPFAMYMNVEEEESHDGKVNENESNIDCSVQKENVENTQLPNEESVNKSNAGTPRKLTVIDPGPSTSKSSKPWIGDDEDNVDGDSKEEDSDWVPFTKKVKTIGRATRLRASKPKIKKVPKKKISAAQDDDSEKIVKDQSLENTKVTTETQQESAINKESDKSSEVSSSDKVKKKKKKGIPKPNKVEEMEVGEVGEEESDKLLSMELKIDDEKKKKRQEKREAKMKEIREKMEALKKQTSSQPDS